jgi:hypothetical protein
MARMRIAIAFAVLIAATTALAACGGSPSGDASGEFVQATAESKAPAAEATDMPATPPEDSSEPAAPGGSPETPESDETPRESVQILFFHTEW